MKKSILAFSLLIFLYSCEKSGDSANMDSGSNLSRGGSMARFVITGKALYVVDHQKLISYDITDPTQFVLKNTIALGWDIETLFNHGNKLFIGSQTGMYIYDISNPYSPKELGKALHLRSCDPVVANATHAFVTLRGGATCGTATDGLYIYDIAKDITKPVLIKQVDLASPFGLGLNKDILYVTQGIGGFSILDVKDPKNPKLLKTIKDETVMDVIIDDNLLIAYVSTGISLYDISDPVNPIAIKKIDNQ